MIKADKIGDKMHLPFVNDCLLLKEKLTFFDTIEKVNLDIGLKKTKKKKHRRRVSVPWYIISVIKLRISRFDSKAKSKISFS